MSEPTKRPGEAIWREVVKPGGAALALAGLALALVPIFAISEWKVPGQWPFAIAVMTVALITWARNALACALNQLADANSEIATLKAESQPHAPKVVYATTNPAEEHSLILLLQPNRLFGQSMLVSIYYEDERGFEQLVAAGRVANVQTNAMIQIAITGWEPAHEELKRHIAAQDATRLARLLVRPAPTTDIGLAAAERAAVTQILSAFLQKEPNDDRQF